METSKFDKMHFETEPEGGEIIPINDWRSDVQCRCVDSSDGIGYWMKNGKVHSSSEGVSYMYGDNVCDEYEIERAIQSGIDAVIWYNK